MLDKRLVLTQTALSLFIKKGIHAVGINEILRESKIAKKTLYHHFTSKEDLIICALEYRDELFIDWLSESMQRATSPTEAMINIFIALDEWFNNKAKGLGNFHGCFFINAAAEYKESNSPINLCCKQHKQNVANLIYNYALKISHDEKQALLITHSICILKEGAITTALVQGDLKAALKVLPMLEYIIGQSK